MLTQGKHSPSTDSEPTSSTNVAWSLDAWCVERQAYHLVELKSKKSILYQDWKVDLKISIATPQNTEICFTTEHPRITVCTCVYLLVQIHDSLKYKVELAFNSTCRCCGNNISLSFRTQTSVSCFYILVLSGSKCARIAYAQEDHSRFRTKSN